MEHAIFIAARPAQIATLDLDAEIKLRVGCWRVLENGQKYGSVTPADTQVDGGEVTDWAASVSPLAALLNRDTLGVDVVLSGSALALPGIVVSRIRACKLRDGTSANGEWNGFGFRA